MPGERVVIAGHVVEAHSPAHSALEASRVYFARALCSDSLRHREEHERIRGHLVALALTAPGYVSPAEGTDG